MATYLVLIRNPIIGTASNVEPDEPHIGIREIEAASRKEVLNQIEGDLMIRDGSKIEVYRYTSTFSLVNRTKTIKVWE